VPDVGTVNLALRAITASFAGTSPRRARGPLTWIERWDAMADRDRDTLDGLSARAKALLRKRAQPKWVAPMLATLTDERISREGWLFEPKWDGERCLAFRRGRELNLFLRNRIRLNEKYCSFTDCGARRAAPAFTLSWAASAEAASGLEVRPADYISQPVRHASGELQ